MVITVTATDNDRSDSTAPYTYTWDTTKYPVGIYDWQAVAIDASGNKTTSAAVRYTIGP